MDAVAENHQPDDDVVTENGGSGSDSESSPDLFPHEPEVEPDHEATKSQDLVLLKAPARDDDGCNPLHLAILHDHEPMVQLLLEFGTHIEGRTKDGTRPLYMAAGNGNTRMVEILPKFRADVDSRNAIKKTTALYETVSRENLEVAEILLAHGADIDAKGPDGHTPLSNAVLKGNLQFVEMLLQHGAQKNTALSNGRTIEDLAMGDNMMRDLLQDDPVLQAERGAGFSIFGEELKSNLGLTHAVDRQFRASTAYFSFMRPLCQNVKPHPKSSLRNSGIPPIVAFIPFLHFETSTSNEEMSRIVQEIKDRMHRERTDANPNSWIMPRPLKRKEKQRKRQPSTIAEDPENDKRGSGKDDVATSNTKVAPGLPEPGAGSAQLPLLATNKESSLVDPGKVAVSQPPGDLTSKPKLQPGVLPTAAKLKSERPTQAINDQGLKEISNEMNSVSKDVASHHIEGGGGTLMIQEG
ncbi:hypothetical protein HYALB_00011794 [Hymenoscyphus albidus]|uniref:Ankyrin repeat protein n=1 Tax=Hymenoscyphus albidus TaxID=595503 RepID=A0A9N9LQX4_9HELO|nr:hypothetical protein HYALB_00011794 [Hymenoscyphus albidus]